MKTIGGKNCWFCGAQSCLEKHHVFYGTGNRRISDEYGMCVFLCMDHHRGSREGVHMNRHNDLKLKQWAQSKFSELHPDKDFIKTFGRNYL
jgi:hypothetical protein